LLDTTLTMAKLNNQLTRNQIINKWWASRRWKYNKGLIIAGIAAFLLYAILGGILIEPYDNDFEVTLFTIGFQGIAYLFMMGIANLFYFLGPVLDKALNKDNTDKFRISLFNTGYWFSVALPFLIPIMIIIQYFTVYRK
jgi:hypothetical protein